LDKKNSSINGAGDKRYPEPDVPVQAAWEQMQQLLLQAPAVPAHTSGFKKWLGKGMGKIVLGAGVVATVSVITFVVLKKNEQKTGMPATYKRDSISTIQPAVAADTLVQVKEKRASVEFDSTPMKKVAAYLEKEFGMKVILKGHIGDIAFTTRFDSMTLQEMLKVITYTLNGKYTIDKVNKQVTISVNGRN
jgi:hypothetical protein